MRVIAATTWSLILVSFVATASAVGQDSAQRDPILVDFPIGDVEVRVVESSSGMVMSVEHRHVGIRSSRVYFGDGTRAVLYTATNSGVEGPHGKQVDAAFRIKDGTEMVVPESALVTWGKERGAVYVRVPNLTFKTHGAETLVQRAEAQVLLDSRGRRRVRVSRNVEGDITGLKLTGMQLAAGDVDEIVAIETLESLTVMGTNISDHDIVRIADCPQLRYLNLSHTDVGDDAVEGILRMKELRTLCIGKVLVTEAGINRLKAANLERGERGQKALRWGYSQLKDGEERKNPF